MIELSKYKTLSSDKCLELKIDRYKSLKKSSILKLFSEFSTVLFNKQTE